MTARPGSDMKSEQKPFVLAVRAIIKDKEGRVLLLRRSKTSRSNAGVWEFPGGKTEPGENFADALVREVKEECGLDVIPTRAVGAVQTDLPNIHVVHLIMEAQLVSGAVRLSEEHDDSAWEPTKDLTKQNILDAFRPFIEYYASVRTG
ncbi:MAG: NUDIX domain-containing protein [candidate division WOR-3 bacterium]|nr:NUDIX domain-containing protein [candidate division WOR-3 bacterium]